jgi:malate dehydrogenase
MFLSTATRRLVVAVPSTFSSSFRRTMATSSLLSKPKVAVLGAAGGIGQSLSLLLKLSPHIGTLSCYDIVGTPGVAADLSHIPTASTVTGHLPASGAWPPRVNEGLQAALTGASVVVIPAGVPRKPGMTRDDLFNVRILLYIIIVFE